MPFHVLWVEGVDFDETLYDTNDLSTLRGASLTLLAMPERVMALLNQALGDDNVELIFSGASLGAFRLTGDEAPVRDAVARVMEQLQHQGRDPEKVRWDARSAEGTPGQLPATAPFAHLRFIWGLAAMAHEADGERAIHSAHASARLMQMQSGAIGEVVRGHALDFCPIDRRRPADASIRVKSDAAPGGYAAHGEDEVADASKSKPLAVSSSVAARRHYGRWARQRFYAAELGLSRDAGKHLSFADSLHDIVDDGPDVTPLALRQKLAVFYADGNKFGQIRAAISQQKGALAGFSTFSSELKRQQKERLLRPLLNELQQWLGAPEDELRKRVALKNTDRLKLGPYLLRLETLLWGGDELTFVVPAWLGWRLARRFFALTTSDDWQIEGHKLTFAAGLLFTSYKTPIREATQLARDLADIAKDAHAQRHCSTLEVEALESVDPPVNGVADLRERLAGISPTAQNVNANTITADELEPLSRKLAAYKRAASPESTIPRSQVYRILQQIDAQGLKPGDTRAGEIAWKEYEQYASRTQRGVPPDDLALLPELGEQRNFGLNFYLLAKLWDYVDPFGDEIQPATRAAEDAA